MATIVLVHGAYQGGWIWARVAPILRAAGHTVFAPSLDGCAERKHALRPGITTELHGAEIADLLFYEDLHDVVLVGTSSGGMVTCRAAELARERIGRVVLADALSLMHGERISDFVKRTGAVTTELTTGPSPEDARGRMFALHAAPDRDDAGAGESRPLLGPALERHGDLVQAQREPAGGASAPRRREAGRPLVRAGHRPLPDADRAAGTVPADPGVKHRPPASP
jgi:pimeloyl-ACP methyl ester carboxylesterase